MFTFGSPKIKVLRYMYLCNFATEQQKVHKQQFVFSSVLIQTHLLKKHQMLMGLISFALSLSFLTKKKHITIH